MARHGKAGIFEMGNYDSWKTRNPNDEMLGPEPHDEKTDMQNALEPLPPARFGLVPANMTEAIELANLMASAKLVPAALQKSVADCLLIIQQSSRWDMDPFAVAQECSVISGKLMYSGKLVAAVINARGNLARRLAFAYSGEGDARTITVIGHFRGEHEPRTVSVILRDARTQNQMWTKQPDQQLAYHGARVWARRHAPELMLGVYSPEEEFDEPPAPLELPNLPTEDQPISTEQCEILDDLLQQSGADEKRFLTFIGAASIEQIPVRNFARAQSALQKKIADQTAANETAS